MDVQQGVADVNGTRLYYEVAGTGAPIALIHGFSLDNRMWDDQFAPFAERHRVVRYDVRGFGKSAPFGDAPYTHADDLAALLDHLAIPHAAIIGLSMGGGIAVNFALAYPAMTSALIPVDAVIGGYQWSEAWKTANGSVRPTARSASINAAKQLWLDVALFTPAREQPALDALLAAMVADYSGRHWLGGDPHQNTEPPAIDRLGEIAAPTLVVVGERDMPDFLVVADTLAQRIPGARKIVLPGVGHMANMETPEQFNADVLGFLDGIG
ncbi:MAG: alpha/beta fold hydrolase [Chloroflexota bacterium]|nr:alpha/beta fold hydrolase [Chloroflexota bacterium]